MGWEDLVERATNVVKWSEVPQIVDGSKKCRRVTKMLTQYFHPREDFEKCFVLIFRAWRKIVLKLSEEGQIIVIGAVPKSSLSLALSQLIEKNI